MQQGPSDSPTYVAAGGISLYRHPFCGPLSIDFSDRVWPEEASDMIHLLETFMERSRQSSLRLVIDFPRYDLDEEVLFFVNELTQSCHRWESLSLTFTPLSPPLNALQSMRGCLPKLRHLCLKLDPIFRTWPGATVFDAFELCPSLRSLDISPAFHTEMHRLRLPWRQVKSLWIRDTYNKSALDMLSECRDVERLQFSSVGGHSRGHPDFQGYLTLNQMKSLIISDATWQFDVDDILLHTTLPEITSLEISGASSRLVKQWAWSEIALTAFLLRSSCIITSLCLRWIPLTDRDALSLLTMLPTVTHLCVEEYCDETTNRVVTKPFLHGLSIPSSSQRGILPSLTNITLVIHEKDIDEQAFTDALSTRCHSRRLGSARIVIMTENHEQRLLDCLRLFDGAGTQITIELETRHGSKQDTEI
ncbi:hypothetical protein V5O48_016908 [Marasmius crinis-equi]|uniref:F-box domain-containing protein n=1 Tax=Marasmius crinis-equi TaxID=585013 RepID=A0ABR3EQF5_9AGAR